MKPRTSFFSSADISISRSGFSCLKLFLAAQEQGVFLFRSAVRIFLRSFSSRSRQFSACTRSEKDEVKVDVLVSRAKGRHRPHGR